MTKQEMVDWYVRFLMEGDEPDVARATLKGMAERKGETEAFERYLKEGAFK